MTMSGKKSKPFIPGAMFADSLSDVECPMCRGRGHKDGRDCKLCSGTGTVSEQVAVEWPDAG